VELAKKNKLIEDLKSKIQQFSRGGEIKKDDEVIDYLVALIKDKEKLFEE